MVESWVKELVEETLGGSNMAVGQTIKHPDGRNVHIVAGQYWGRYGLSNSWTWREVMADGSLGPRESGYGWC